jgi:hypothetical protein
MLLSLPQRILPFNGKHPLPPLPPGPLPPPPILALLRPLTEPTNPHPRLTLQPRVTLNMATPILANLTQQKRLNSVESVAHVTRVLQVVVGVVLVGEGFGCDWDLFMEGA